MTEADILSRTDADLFPHATYLHQAKADLATMAQGIPVRRAALWSAFKLAASAHAAGAGPTQRPTTRPNLMDATLGSRFPLRLLLVEDNLVNQKVALHMLKRLGYEADVANNGREATEATSRTAYDLVLMDMQMPEMDGLEATRQIRANAALVRQPVIVAMTAAAMREDEQACLAAGMDSVITKPIEVARLVRALSDAADRMIPKY